MRDFYVRIFLDTDHTFTIMCLSGTSGLSETSVKSTRGVEGHVSVHWYCLKGEEPVHSLCKQQKALERALSLELPPLGPLAL